jgi:hypothetical protein
MDNRMIAGEILKVARLLSGMEFDTKGEMEQYKKEHDVQPGTKLTVKKKQRQKKVGPMSHAKATTTEIARPLGLKVEKGRDENEYVMTSPSDTKERTEMWADHVKKYMKGKGWSEDQQGMMHRGDSYDANFKVEEDGSKHRLVVNVVSWDE